MDLVEIAERLDAEEKLKLKYKCIIKKKRNESAEVVRIDRLLDVEPEQGVLFVSFNDRDVIWIRLQEAIEVMSDDGKYGEAADY